MKGHNLTIKDIARELNVSPSTVSRALKDNPYISRETRKMIQEYARKHKYKPNTLALSLRTKHTNIVGVIVPELANHFFPEFFPVWKRLPIAMGIPLWYASPWKIMRKK